MTLNAGECCLPPARDLFMLISSHLGAWAGSIEGRTGAF
jgi:hypothetical protein